MTQPLGPPPKKADLRFDDWIWQLWRRSTSALTSSGGTIEIDTSGTQVSIDVKQMNLAEIMAFAAAHG